MTKKFLCTIMAIVTLLSLCSCISLDPQPQTFEKDDFSITLTDEFAENSHVSMTYYFVSNKALAMVLKEEFTIFEQAEISTDISLEEYAGIIIQANNLTGAETGVDEKNNVYFTWERTLNGKDFFYYAVVKRGEDAYWLCQFACEIADTEAFTPKFAEWGASIVV